MFDPLTKRQPRHEPAASIIARFGGDREVARILEVARSTVTKFASAGRDGRHGEIPRRYREALIKAAADRGWTLVWEDFAWRPRPLVGAEPGGDRITAGE